MVVIAAVGCRGAESLPGGAGSGAGSGSGSGGEAGVAAGGGGDAGAEDGGVTARPTLAEAMQEYRGWMKRQAAPRQTSAEIFSLCRLPSLAETKFTESVHGKDLALLDWLNEAAARGIAAGGKPAFPVGAAIVKQKLLGLDADAKVAALGIMVKRQSGFDPAHGDWEFGYWEQTPGLKSGSEAANSCGGCHKGSPTDFVFIDQSWRTER
jgi:Cytochrome P460